LGRWLGNIMIAQVQDKHKKGQPQGIASTFGRLQ